MATFNTWRLSAAIDDCRACDTFAGMQHIASVRCGGACEWGEWQLATVALTVAVAVAAAAEVT